MVNAALRFGVAVHGIVAFVALPRTLWAQDAILLRLSPRAGDTIHTWLTQQLEVSAATPGGLASPSRSVTTTMAIFSRTIVRSVQAASTTVLTIVDSARVSSTDARAAAQSAATQKALRGQQLVMQLGADGMVEQANDSRGISMPRNAAQAMAAMPAVFPRTPVKVGDQWTREMALPSSGPLGGGGAGHARAVFHLDSIRKGGAVAFVSMKGEIHPDSSSQGMEMSGTISGTMQLDRARGWMTDSRFVVLLKSLLKPSMETGMMPMQFITRVTQRLQTMDKR